MTVKRKRNRHGSGNGGDSKRQRISDQMISKDSVVKQAVLSQYYTQVVSLRRYLLSKLPPTSKLRRKKILSFDKRKQPDSIVDASFSRFLDQTIVGVRTCRDVSFQERSEKWVSFSQRVDTSDSTFTNLTGIGIYSQSEVGFTPGSAASYSSADSND
ncbi:hypothetical protein B0O99DRAFT_20989 [Bisporella sp. PMI_857]|nr:hypothetical protein B0O99DRAFT_20989 [Bisporella sp. PMI_857]